MFVPVYNALVHKALNRLFLKLYQLVTVHLSVALLIGEGLFLVRNGQKVGDFTLSIFHDDRPVHFHIEQHGLGAQYSIKGGEIFNGLDRLINHYSRTGDGLPTRLTTFLKNGMPLPFSSIKFGRTNVLHHVSKEGNARLVKMVLDSGRYDELVNAKSEDGTTALHIASYCGYDDVVGMLIDKGADVDSKDAQGYNPLHQACAGNRPSTVSLLISRYDCDPQEPSYCNGWVPLHVAASWGHTDCAKVLLALNTPVRPRTDKDELPVDLAMNGAHVECMRLLENYQAPPPKTNASHWYHRNANRALGKNRLEAAGLVNGMFLLRPSHRKDDVYILTMVCDKTTYNYEVEKKNKFVYIGNGPYLDSVDHLIDHYSRFKDGLPTKLTQPIGDLEWNPTPAPRPESTPAQSGLASQNTSGDVPLPAGLRLIQKTDLQLQDEIGVGEYGSVLKGKQLLWSAL